MKYSTLAFLIAWMFPTQKDRAEFRNFCKKIECKKNSVIIQKRYTNLIKKLTKQKKT